MNRICQGKKRLDWVDAVKGITVLLVVFHHSCLASYEGFGITNSGSLIDLLVSEFSFYSRQARMPAFFFISGIVFSLVKGKKISWFFNKRLPFMVWIIGLWTLLSIAVESVVGLHLYPWESFPYFEKGYHIPMPYGNIWFIYALLIISFLAALIDDFGFFVKLWAGIVFSLIFHLYLVFFTPEHDISKWLFENIAYKGIPLFILGALLSPYIMKFSHDIKISAIATFLSFTLWLLLSIFSEPSSDYASLLTRYIPSTFTFVGLIILLCRIAIFCKVFQRIGEHSLDIFLLHQFLIASILFLYNQSHFYLSAELSKVALMILPVVTCLIVVFSLKRTIKPLLLTPPYWWGNFGVKRSSN